MKESLSSPCPHIISYHFHFHFSHESPFRVASSMAIFLSFSPHPPPNPTQGPNQELNSPTPSTPKTILVDPKTSKRDLLLRAAPFLFISSLTYACPSAPCLAEAPPPAPRSTPLPGIANTKSWFQFYGDGFSIRVPPQFEDIMEPEDFNAGSSLYGDKVKPKKFAARFASIDGSEVLSVVTRPTNQLKITFLEAKDVSDLGSLKEAAKIFIPGGSTLYSARTIKIKEDEGFRTYYFYEFGRDEQHVALVAAVNSGKAIIAGATAPQSKWDGDGVKLRSAAISLSVL